MESHGNWGLKHGLSGAWQVESKTKTLMAEETGYTKASVCIHTTESYLAMKRNEY